LWEMVRTRLMNYNGERMTVSPEEAERRIKESEAESATLLAVSAKTFQTFRESISELDRSSLNTKQKGFISLVENGQKTSEAVQLLRQSGHYVHAIGLARMRFEEITVCSYLINERSEDVAERYFTYGPVGTYLTAKKALDDPYLASLVPTPNDLSAMYMEAAIIEENFNPGFDIEKGKVSPKWTSLDLYSMAIRRDSLAEGRYPLVLPLKLAPLYNSFYKTGSAVLHVDASLLCKPFVGELVGLDGVARDVSRFWNMVIPGLLVAYDQFQCMEVLAYLVETLESQGG
jgi:hypothetical protein